MNSPKPHVAGQKHCFKCDAWRPLTQFSRDASRADGLQPKCKGCMSAYKAARRGPKRPALTPEQRKEARRLSLKLCRQKHRERISDEVRRSGRARERASRVRGQTPAWADHSKIMALYHEARAATRRTGVPHQVDHIVPLKSPTVSGLHCEANLQVVPAVDNATKGNRHWPDKP